MKTPSHKSLKIVSAVLAVAVLVMLAVFAILPRLNAPEAGTRPQQSNGDLGGAEQTPAVPVEVARARIGDLVQRLTATGLTRARREITVAPRVAGQVVEIGAREGEFVPAGGLLLRLDDREYALALAEARDRLLGAQVDFGLLLREKKRTSLTQPRAETNGARAAGDSAQWRRLQAARQRFQLAKEKRQRGEITQDELEQARLEFETEEVLSGAKRDQLLAHKTGLTAAQLAVQRAELNLSYTRIRAPFPGFVADLKVEKGQQVAVGQVCCKLVDLSQIDVDVQVLESEIGLVQEGRHAEVTFPAYPDEVFAGQVVHLNPMVDTETKTARATVRLQNPDRRLLPGMFAYVKLDAKIYKNRLLVPRDAILVRDQRKLLFIVRDGLAKWCYVTTGLENEDFVEIVDSTFGLKPGELVITGGHYTLAHDARVRFTAPEPNDTTEK